jgi:hypothetical protein
MTTQETYKSTGNLRLAVPYASTLGLSEPGYFWSESLRPLTDDSIVRALGHATPELTRCVDEEFDLDDFDRDALLRLYQEVTFRPLTHGMGEVT